MGDEGMLISNWRHLHSLAPYAHPAQYDRAGQVTGVRALQVLENCSTRLS
jgi:hypothetical protein